MEPSKTQTSFMPKKPFAETKRQAGGIFILIASVIFFAVLLISGGLVVYSSVLDQQIASGKASLELARGQFDPAVITEISQLNTRIESAKKILNSHIAVSPLLTVLSKTILKTVRFVSLTFTRTDDGAVGISIKGQAVNYSAVAYQSDVIAQNRYLKNPVFSNLAVDQSGNVTFDLTATIDPTLLLYSNNFTSAAKTSTQ